jgi:hypothetical protein
MTSTDPPRSRFFDAQLRRQVTFVTLGVATYTVPPPDPSCAAAVAGAATAAHRNSAQAPRFA